MAIAFTLDLSPRQIEFLQQLDLYSDGVIPINTVGCFGGDRWMQNHFVTAVGKLIREGLVEHVAPEPGNTRYEGQTGGGSVIQAYRITEKGRAVLSLIESDVQAFLKRQKAYTEAKANGNGKKKRA